MKKGFALLVSGYGCLALLCLLHAPLLVQGLKCHCDICSETNNTCETDGYCFASTSLDKDGITYAYRCYNKENFFPDPMYSVWCSSNDALRGPGGTRFVVTCCDHADFCNRDVKAALPSTISAAQSSYRSTHRLEGGITREHGKSAFARWD